MTTPWTSQSITVLKVSLKGLRRRWWPSLNLIVGTASVVGVLVVLLSIAAGYTHAMNMTGSADNIIVMRSGGNSELESSLSGAQAQLIKRAAAVSHDEDGAPMAAAELYAIASIPDDTTGDPRNVAVRGVEPMSYQLRHQWHLARGRKPEPGRREVLIGRRAQQSFPHLVMGSQVAIADGQWRVVGVFEADGGVVESELWADAPMLQSALQRGDNVQVVYARAVSTGGAAGLSSELARDPRLDVTAETEADYYQKQSGQMGRFVKTLGYSIAAMMGLAALFAALNAGTSATSSRTREIATLMALGIDDRAIAMSVLAESVLLALIGGVLGSAVAYLLFNGHIASTFFYSRNFSQVVFAFTVTGGVLVQAVVGALLIGVIGGMMPALRVTRMPVSQALAVRR
ncbi:MAG: ABC transporter permease [Rhodanobacter sp.]